MKAFVQRKGDAHLLVNGSCAEAAVAQRRRNALRSPRRVCKHEGARGVPAGRACRAQRVEGAAWPRKPAPGSAAGRSRGKDAEVDCGHAGRLCGRVSEAAAHVCVQDGQEGSQPVEERVWPPAHEGCVRV